MKYSYRAVNSDGGSVTGTLEAENSRAAARMLRRQGLNVVDLKDAVNPHNQRNKKARPPKGQDLHIFMHQLCTLLESGVSLEEAVDSMAESAGHPFLAHEFSEITAAIRRGEMFSQALKASRLKLPAYLYPLTEAGELTGKLAQSIRDGVQQWEYDLQTANELRNSLIYPIILIVSGIGAVLLIFILVVPKFVNLLDKSQGDIPLLATLVLGTGRFVNEHLLLVGLGVAALGGVVSFMFSNEEIRRRGRDVLAGFPVLETWMKEADLARWSAMMATLLENRVPLLNSLELARSYVTLAALHARLSHVIRGVRGGVSLAEALRESDAITMTGYNLVRVGERSGQLPAMLRSLAVLYAESGRNRIKRSLAFVEPVAIIVIGAVIGMIMGGIILAITSVNNISI